MSKRILVIEGDPVLGDGIWRLLSGHGYKVELAANGEQAVEGLLGARFDTVILDLRLIDIGGCVLARILAAEGARGRAPSLIGLVEHRHLLAVSKVGGAIFKAILSKPVWSGALIDAISDASSRPAPMGAALPLQGDRRNRVETEHAARDLSTAHWRRCGLQIRPRVFACPRPTPDQEKALKLCFDMVEQRDADLIILLERHGMSEANRLARSTDKIHRPVIALSHDHADLCEAVFEIASETSWHRIAALVRRDGNPSGVVLQVDGELSTSGEAGRVMPQVPESSVDDIALPKKAPFNGGANIFRVLNQKRGQIVALASETEGVNGSRDQWKKPLTTGKISAREASSQGCKKAAQVLLIEGNEIGNPGLIPNP